MANDFSQAGRLASISLDALKDKLALERFTARTRLSEPFEISIDVMAASPVDFVPALYQPVAIRMEAQSRVARAFHGLLYGVERLEDEQTVVRYRLSVGPWLRALQERSDIRIFQDQNALQIIEQVFSDAGFSDFDLSAVQTPPPLRDYCVQYRETDFAFVSRLMEEEGLYYFFRHSEGGHELVVADGPAAHQPPPSLPSVDFMPPGGLRSRRRVNIWRWSERLRTAVSALDVGEHHFLTPRERNSGAAKPSDSGPTRSESAFYEYPAKRGASDEESIIKPGKLPKESGREAELRLQALRAEQLVFLGEGDAFEALAGDKLTLARHPQSDLNGDYLLVGSTHVFSTESYRSGGDQDAGLQLFVEAIPFATRWRAPRVTPKPSVGGPQTARVVGPLKDPGPTDDTIHVDKYGRVKVQFFWDREGKWLQNSSCWVRVSQGWADGGFGAVMLPRIGQEVIVDFLDGDPDRPIITGRVYNADKMQPYALPDRKTVSTLKSRTVGKPGSYPEAEEPPKSGDPGFNELRFEDAGGKEEVFLHAQRDRKTWVRLDHQEKIGRDQGQRVGRNRSAVVHKHESLEVETGDETRTVKKGSRKTKIHADDTLTVEKGNSKTTVQSGDYTVTVSKGKALIEAKQSIELKVGKTNIKLTPAGIEMNGLTIKMDAKTALSAKGGMTTDLKAGLSFTINGMVVMIN
jgi:type VI secretion system secreted protein VgrG